MEKGNRESSLIRAVCHSSPVKLTAVSGIYLLGTASKQAALGHWHHCVHTPRSQNQSGRGKKGKRREKTAALRWADNRFTKKKKKSLHSCCTPLYRVNQKLQIIVTFWCSPSVCASTEMDEEKLAPFVYRFTPPYIALALEPKMQQPTPLAIAFAIGKQIISVPLHSNSAAKNRPSLCSP